MSVCEREGIWVSVCAFIKLHKTALSGTVIIVIQCYSHWFFQEGINDTYYENLRSDARKGTQSCSTLLT